MYLLISSPVLISTLVIIITFIVIKFFVIEIHAGNELLCGFVVASDAGRKCLLVGLGSLSHIISPCQSLFPA